MKKVLIAFTLFVFLLGFIPSAYCAALPDGFWQTSMAVKYANMPAPSPSADDDDMSKVFFYYADSIAKATFDEVSKRLKSLNYTYTGGIGNDYTLTQINIPLKLGEIYMAFYPIDVSSKSTAFGDPKREYLSTVEYTRGDYTITISDSLHVTTTTCSVLNRNDDPPKHIVKQDFLVKYYNYEIGGSINANGSDQRSASADGRTEVKYNSTDLQSTLSSVASSRARQYLEVKISEFTLRYDPDSNAITQMQIRLTWNYENGIDRTKKMLEMYSDDLAVILHEKYPDIKISELYMFWNVPYLVKNGVAAKYLYESRYDKMYRIGTFGPIYQ